MSDNMARPITLAALASKSAAFTPMTTAKASPVAEPAIDAFALGLAEGQQIAEAAFAVERAAFRDLLSNAQALKAEASAETSLLMREAVFGLVRQIIGDVAIDERFVERQIAQAIAILGEADDARQLVLHPNDAALIGATANGLAVLGDATMARGNLRIVCSQGWIDHGIATGLDRLRAFLHVEGAAS